MEKVKVTQMLEDVMGFEYLHDDWNIDLDTELVKGLESGGMKIISKPFSCL